MKKTVFYVILVVTLSFVVNGDITNNTSPVYGGNSSDNIRHTYKVFVDGYHGFYRIYNVDTREYTAIGKGNETVNIHINDAIIWENEDNTESFTIVSEPVLWKNGMGYIRPAKRFSYTFNRSGIYKVYIRQRQIFSPQIIVVQGINNTINKNTTTKNTIIKNSNETTEITEKIISRSDKGTSNTTITKYKKSKNDYDLIIAIAIPMTLIIYVIYMLKRRKKEDKSINEI